MSNLLIKGTTDNMLSDFIARQGDGCTASLSAISYVINGWKGELALIQNYHTLTDQACVRSDLLAYAKSKKVKDGFAIDRVASAVANALPIVAEYDFVNSQWDITVGVNNSQANEFAFEQLSTKLLEMGTRDKSEWILCNSSPDRVNGYLTSFPRLVQSWSNPPVYDEANDTSQFPKFNKLRDDKRLVDPISWWKSMLSDYGLDITLFKFEIVSMSNIHNNDGAKDSLTIVSPGDTEFKVVIATGPRLKTHPDIRFLRFAGRYGIGGQSGLSNVSTYISRSSGSKMKLVDLGFSSPGMKNNANGYDYEYDGGAADSATYTSMNKHMASIHTEKLVGLWPVQVQRDDFDLGSDALNNLSVVPNVVDSIAFFGQNTHGDLPHKKVSQETFAFHQRGFHEVKIATAGYTTTSKSNVPFHNMTPNNIRVKVPMMAVDAYMRERLAIEKDPKMKSQLQQGIDKLQSKADAIITAKIHSGALPYPNLESMQSLEFTSFANKGDIDLLNEPLNDDGLTLIKCLERCDKHKSKGLLYHTFCLVNDEQPVDELLVSENAKLLVVSAGSKLVITGTKESPVFSGLLADGSVLGLNTTDSKILFCYANSGMDVSYDGLSDGSGYDDIKLYFNLTDEGIADVINLDIMSKTPKAISSAVRADFKALSASDFVDSSGYPFLYPAAGDEYTRAVLAYKGVGDDPSGIILSLLFASQ